MMVDEFVEWDDGTDTRYELVYGVPVARVPTSLDHGAILSALAGEVGSRLRQPWRALTGAGVRIPCRDDLFFVADLAIVCAPWSRGDRYLTSPVVLVEVLSPSTAGHDRGTKAANYRSIPSVQEIVLVSASTIAAEVWRRGQSGWLIEDLSGSGAELGLPSVGVSLTLGAIYNGIPLEEPPAGTTAAAAG